MVDGDKGLFDAAFAHAQGFDLRAVEGDARFIFFIYKIIVVRFLVVGNEADTF